MSSQTVSWSWKRGSNRQVSRNGSSSDKESNLIPSYLDSKPREEKNYKEFYPDLDEERPLKVLIVANDNDDQHEESLPVPPNNSHLKKPIFRKLEPIQDLTQDKFSKTMISLGYRDTDQSTNLRPDVPYIRPDKTVNTLTNNTLTKNDTFQVMYDMDEQDVEFIKLLNNKHSKEYPVELLEIAFTFLEREWYLLEKILPPKRKPQDSMNSDEIIDKATQHTAIYGSDDGSGCLPEEDQCCAVCNESECDNSNAIVFCDGCDIAVHQECYGVVFIPEGQWLCRRCLISRNNKSQCLFCPSTTGAFKQTENGSWCHAICALWISELYFANPVYMEPVEGYDLIPKSRWRLLCYICKQKIGACIQCSNRNCFQLYHVTCARRSELYLHAKNGTQFAMNNPSTLVSYCDKHGPASYNQTHDVRTGIEKTRLYFATVGAIKSKNSAVNTVNIHKKTESPFRWKSEFDTPIAPEIFAVRLLEFLRGINLHVDREVVYRLCSYWSLKREHKRGAPLIKRLDTAQYGALNSQEIDERLFFLNQLTLDVDKLCDLAKLTSRRTELQSKILDFKFMSLDLVYFPVNYIIETLLERISVVMDKHYGLSSIPILDSPSYRDIMGKVNNYSYKSVTEFINEFEQLMDVISTMKSTLAVNAKKSYARWKRELPLRYQLSLNLESMIRELLDTNKDVDLVEILSSDQFQISGIEVDLQKWQGPDISDDLTDVDDPIEEL